jgi:predicted AlkP superfamily pyrophosphatase or phosphodiesterase
MPTPPTPWADNDRAVILVSLDGFRFDYLGLASTPTLDRLVEQGVHADALVPVFPSKTFPNHFTQVTGLYPHEHGIVGNSFYDQDLGAIFDMQEIGEQWWGGEPIWVTAANQGLRSATMFWPGSETAYDGVRPDEWVPFDGGLPNEARVDQVLAWQGEAQPPHFTTLYFSDVDSAGHAHGPSSQAVVDAVEAVDAYLARLIDGLEAMGRLDAVDVLVVSDHGMVQQSRDRAIFLDDYVDPDDFWINAWGPYVTLDPKTQLASDVLPLLAEVPHASCSDASTRPAELHFPAGPRIPPILCLADGGWGITSRPWFDTHLDDLTRATHGYASSDPEMHGLFIGRGPHLQSGVTHPAFSSVHLYELMADLLAIEPSPNSGDLAVTAAMLAD